MEIAYVLVQSEMTHELDVANTILKLEGVKEVKGTFGYYDILVKIQAASSSEIQEIITKKIRKIKHVTSTTTLSVIPEQDTA